MQAYVLFESAFMRNAAQPGAPRTIDLQSDTHPLELAGWKVWCQSAISRRKTFRWENLQLQGACGIACPATLA